jgi:hypothetical protein
MDKVGSRTSDKSRGDSFKRAFSGLTRALTVSWLLAGVDFFSRLVAPSVAFDGWLTATGGVGTSRATAASAATVGTLAAWGAGAVSLTTSTSST